MGGILPVIASNTELILSFNTDYGLTTHSDNESLMDTALNNTVIVATICRSAIKVVK
jgi:hypothetical protein